MKIGIHLSNERTRLVGVPFSSVNMTEISFPLVTVKTTSVTFGGCGVLKVNWIVTGATDPGADVTPVVENTSVGTVAGGRPVVVTVMTDVVVCSISSTQAECKK